VDRYSRQLIVPEIGKAGQENLRRAHILVAGVGGLGGLSSVYLCRAGVGTLTIVDGDRVEASDLNRQILYREEDIGEKKALLAKTRLSEMNGDVVLNAFHLEIGENNVSELLRGVQIVVDGTDNFKTRYLLNKACHQIGIPFVYGGIFGFRGSVMTIIPGKTPCLACLLPHKEEVDSPIPAVGPLVGAIASIQAMEVLKLILNVGEPLAGRLLVVDGIKMGFRKFAVKRRRECDVCSGS
jgi:molybdopterin/thiamine biosynthesis adenylyltransferase